MDHFGIGHAMQSMVRVYCQSARRSGRTTSLLESVKSGDRVVFINEAQASEFRRLCKERQVDVSCIVAPVNEPDRLFQRPPSEGRTLFDHVWIEEYYMTALERCAAEIDHLQRETSGFGAAHEETRRMALERSKWR